jgi:fumarylacetoacetate (FAA) hydrolase
MEGTTMKLASYKSGRDGQLYIVSNDLTKTISAISVAPTLQAALDEWDVCAPKLLALHQALEDGSAKNFENFDQSKCASPLPRAYQVADGSAYLNHVELVRKARGAEMPESFLTDPLMYQGVSDTILDPTQDIEVISEDFGIDFEGEIAIITTDVPMGVSAEDAPQYIALVMTMNDVSLRNLIPNELGKGFGFFNAKPPSAFSPTAVTPESLGDAWDGRKFTKPLISTLNGAECGQPNCGVEMQFDFGELIAHAAKTRPLGAGAIIGSGTISNSNRAVGYSCLAEIRMIEKIESGEFKTPFMKFGDSIKIEAKDANGQSIFGTIEQKIVQYNAAANPVKKSA